MNQSSINIILGIIVLILNSIPIIINKRKYFGLTLSISSLIIVIRILFI